MDGAYTFTEVYNMPVHMRNFYMKKAIHTKKKEQEYIKKQTGSTVPSGRVKVGPSVRK